MAGLDVHYDFDWRMVIGHGRTAFPNGKNLANEVRSGCPAVRTPCLLLTIQDDMDEGPIPTDDANNVVVIRIQKYLARASASPALSYLAGQSGLNVVAAARRARRAVSSDHELDEYLERTLTEAALVRWAGQNVDRIAMLQSVLAIYEASIPASEHDVARPRHAVRQGDLSAIKSIMQAAESDVIERVAYELASTTLGRRAASRALADQLPARIEDIHKVAEEYRRLLSKPGTTETDLQEYIERKPQLLGLEYAQVLPGQAIPRGRVDFMVRRHDGYHDLLELKGPEDPIVVLHRGKDPSNPSSYSLAPKLAQALAQVQLYREWLAITPDSSMEKLYQVSFTRDPRVTIVIGRASALPNSTAGTILRQLNLTLHRMEVMPYDVLADRAVIQSKNLATFARCR